MATKRSRWWRRGRQTDQRVLVVCRRGNDGIARALRATGYRVKQVHSAEVAAVLMNVVRFDLVVAEDALGDVRGLELLCRVRAEHPGVLRLLTLSGIDPLLIFGAVRSAGVHRVLTDSPDPAHVVTAVDQALLHTASQTEMQAVS